MSGKLDKGGIVTNLDLSLSNADLREGEKMERAGQILDEAKKEARAHDGDNFTVYGADEKQPDQHTVTKSFLEKTAREIANENAIKPISVIEGDPTSPFGRTWVLTERDQQAINEWRFCPACLQAQRDQTTAQCTWKIPAHHMTGCNYNRIAERYIRNV